MGLLSPLLSSYVDTLNGLYAPIDESLFIRGTDLSGVGGSPAVDAALGDVAKRHPAMQFDATAEENVAFTFRVPFGWTGFVVDVVWANSSTGTGGVVWTVTYQRYGSGSTLGGETAGGGATGTAGAKNVVVITRPTASALPVVAGETVWIELSRTVGNAGDTLANDAGVLGVLVGKA